MVSPLPTRANGVVGLLIAVAKRRAGRSCGRRQAARLAVAALFTAVFLIGVTESTFTSTADNTSNNVSADTLDPPPVLTATDGTTAGLDWTSTVDTYATGHRIFRSSTSGGPYTQIAEITPRTSVSYIDTHADGTYYYVARAYAATWESANSNEATARIWQPFDCPSDPDLRACIRFDTDVAGTYLDESGNANTVTHSNGLQVAGISDKAAFSPPTSHYEIADSPSLDLTDAMTIETWLRVDSLPSSGRAGILDNDGQYSLFIYAGTGLRCSNGLDDLPHHPIAAGAWIHVACAWDGTTLTLYLDGQPAETMPSSGTIDTTNTDGVSLLNSSPAWNEPLDGSMDNLRVWHVGRSQAQICADAEISGC